MAGNAPYTVEIPLKSRDRSEVCPEVERCQLAVEVKPKAQAIALVNTGMGGMAVQVKLVREGKGCDAEVYVGLVQSTGARAIGEDAERWETRLPSCMPLDPWLDHVPLHLRCSRKKTESGRVISLIVTQDAEETWRVWLDTARVGTLKIDYPKRGDNTLVTAALHASLQMLFVCESVVAMGAYTASWYIFTADPVSGQWSLYESAVLTSPIIGQALNRHAVIDEFGHVSGYWAVDSAMQSEAYTADGDCHSPQAVPGNRYDRSVRAISAVHGGYFDVLSRRQVSGAERRHGQTLIDGQFVLLVETIASGWGHLVHNVTSTWSGGNTGSYSAEWEQSRTLDTDDVLHFGTNIGASTKDYGLTSHFTGYSHQWTTVDLGPPAMITDKEELTCGRFEYHDGSTTINVTPGGWVTVADVAEVQRIDASPWSYEHTYPYVAGWGVALCPDIEDVFYGRGVTTENRAETTINWPVSLGRFYGLTRSFCSVDQTVDPPQYYAGVYRSTIKNGPSSWAIFGGRGVLDTLSLTPDCLGHALDSLHAIYWRAE